MRTQEIKDDMMRHIKAHNKNFTNEYLNMLLFDELLCEVHPLYRDSFQKQIKDNEKDN